MDHQELPAQTAQTPGKRPVAPQEELRSATEVMVALLRSAKGVRMYLANNPMLVKYLEELQEKLGAHLDRYGSYPLEVEPFSLNYKGSELYRSEDRRDNLALRLHADGIRLVQFVRGIEPAELATFLEVAGFERPDRDDDDVVTRLWAEHLPHVSYLLEEDLVGIDALEIESEAVASQQEALDEITASLAKRPAPPQQMIPKHLLMLTAEDAGWLRKAVQTDARRNAVDDVITILAATLAGVQDPASFEEFTSITGKLVIDLFRARQIPHAQRLVRFLGQLMGLGSLPAERRQKVADVLEGILCEEVLQALAKTINETESLSREELRELLMVFGVPSLGAICELLGRLEKLKMRKVVIEVLIELGGQRPELFAPFLADPRWYLVRNVALVLALIGGPTALKMIVGLISHREVRIRREVLNFLAQSPDPKARPYLLKFLRDDASALRVRVLKIIAQQRLTFALKPLLALAASEELKNRGMEERLVLFETLGELGSVQMVPLFKEMLVKKSWFKRSVSKESAQCAVAGLLKVHHDSARQLLEELRRQGGSELRSVIDQALQARHDDAGTSAA
ncbi:hypothetical protein GMST_08090 [Geomonas silvestris]|uniref:HEAT repeat domain-containing protein n=1 Tax=Geomonas silvestris TaxID=2740184 RepID=A0A6V8MF32_9BACT|nr:HEAT repeat domain-containing protein [Geomonas silvestris]GFO58484.1 hypothetical protein GMST_08090 [Geomonas silvestris]